MVTGVDIVGVTEAEDVEEGDEVEVVVAVEATGVVEVVEGMRTDSETEVTETPEKASSK